MTGRDRVALFSLAWGMAWGIIALLFGTRYRMEGPVYPRSSRPGASAM